MRYLLIHYIDESIFLDENGQEIEDPKGIQALEASDNEMKSRGILVGGGALQQLQRSRVRRPGRGDRGVIKAPDRQDRHVRVAAVPARGTRQVTTLPAIAATIPTCDIT
jgi:hypothetical protein